MFCAFLFSCNQEADKPVTQPPNDSLQVLELKNAISKYPDSLPLFEKLITHYRNKGEYDSALAVTDNLILIDSNIADLWDIKGTLHFENGDTINTINSFERAIQIVPLPEYVIALGTLYAQIKNPKALTLANALQSADMANASKEAFFIKGLYYTYTGNKKKAIALFDTCIKLDYTYMFAYREKAIALYDQAKYEEALKVLNKAVTVQNNFDEGYYWMGNCYKKLNRKEEAIQSYHTALLYDKNFIEARDSLKTIE
jgi:tetratricopeptide (TPR) repeat protein